MAEDVGGRKCFPSLTLPDITPFTTLFLTQKVAFLIGTYLPALKNIDVTLEYFSAPKHPEKVCDIDEFHVARTAGDGVEGNENQTAVEMLLPTT
ncbi:MAG: hypothetical protein IJ524_00880 [Bacteroidales bacterium]|nr:hypothetical protein [Bacteroidales bacterium]